MSTTTEPKCSCRTYIGDDPDCPVHRNNNEPRLLFAPRVISLLSEEDVLRSIAIRHNVSIVIKRTGNS